MRTFFWRLRVKQEGLQLPFFFLFFLPVVVFGRNRKCFSHMLSASLLRTRVTSIGLVVPLHTRKEKSETILRLVVTWYACGTWQTMCFSFSSLISNQSIRKRIGNKLENRLKDDNRFKTQKWGKRSWYV